MIVRLSELPNVGIEVEKQLLQTGIQSYDQLKELGAEATYKMVIKIN